MSNFLVGTNLSNVKLDKFNGNASTLAFTLSVPSSTFSALVRISGVVQTPTDDFSIVNSTLTFTTAPPSGSNNIVVTYTKAAQIGVPNDASVSSVKILDANITTSKIADDAVTLAKIAPAVDGSIISFDASQNPVLVAPGNDGQVLTSAGAGAQPAFEDAAAGGKVVQVVNVMNGAVATGTTQIPASNSIPHQAQGNEFMTLAITPANASNKLKIDVVASVGNNSSSSSNTVALFQDSTSNALAVVLDMKASAQFVSNVKLTHFMTAGTTSATTFKVRAGSNQTATTTFNGRNSGRFFGGVFASSITITEISA